MTRMGHQAIVGPKLPFRIFSVEHGPTAFELRRHISRAELCDSVGGV